MDNCEDDSQKAERTPFRAGVI